MLRPAATLLAAFTLLCGVAYPVLVTAVAHATMPHHASGSLLQNARDSELIGQAVTDPRSFWTRPSATGYDAKASGASNLGPSNPALHALVATRVAALRAADPEAPLPVPVDLVTASGSGLDPHVSPAAAQYQVHRVARARHVDEETLRQLVRDQVIPRTWGVLGEPRIDVRALNRALDAWAP
jgi:K+-transporting ATPase ATPase C chain